VRKSSSALSNAAVAPAQQRRMKTLLRKNARGKLSERERTALDVLLEEADRIALLKARAAYTLAELRRQRAAAV
jgi:hypothetical protein